MTAILDYRRLAVGGTKMKKNNNNNKQYFIKLGISVETCREITFVTKKH